MKSQLVAMFTVVGLLFGCAKNQNQMPVQNQNEAQEDSSALDELNPFDPNVQNTLTEMDRQYQNKTGQSAHLKASRRLYDNDDNYGCVQLKCHVYAQIVKSTQTLYLYIDGQLTYTWKVSTGVPGRETPLFNQHPDGRIYDAYSSHKYPGGDYQGLGNMPYAVFIDGGFAIHGTGRSNWSKLGSKASHGCVRLHPDNAKIFNRLVRESGIDQVWISVQED